MVDFFQKMSSNTLAGSANQTFFYTEESEKEYVGRVFYKVFCGGTYRYAFLFSGATDSSFPIENKTPADTPILDWEITFARVGICNCCDISIMPNLFNLKPLYFKGKRNKKVDTSAFFCTDEIQLSAQKGEYICLEIGYKGERIPHHFENSIPAFEMKGDAWVPSNRAVFASMVGCDRKVEQRIAFLGDSITQGLGVENNSYKHWNALISDMLGEKYAFWNLGIGFGMANDCAIGKQWLNKAKKNDIVVVCFGVNDLSRVKNGEQTKKDLLYIVQSLKSAGCKVLLQTIPACNPHPSNLRTWEDVNEYILTRLKDETDIVFDTSSFLQKEGMIATAKYGVHPSEEGCEIWAKKLVGVLKNMLGDR